MTQPVIDTLADGAKLNLRLKAPYKDLPKLKEDAQGSYAYLYKYYKALYSKLFDPKLIQEVMTTQVGKSLLTNYLSSSVKGSYSPVVTKVVNVGDYSELVKGDIKYRKSESRFIRGQEFKDIDPTVVLVQYHLLTEMNPKPNDSNLKTVAFIIDLVGKYKFAPHVKAKGSYKTTKMGQTVTGYSLEPYKQVLLEYRDVNTIYLLRGDNVFSAYRILMDVLTHEENIEGVFDNVDDEDMSTLLRIITQTAVNGSQIYGYNDLPTLDRALKEMLYSTVLEHSMNSNIQAYRNHAKAITDKYTSKKTVSPGIQYMASKSYFLESGFSYVEYDQEIDRDRINKVNNEFKALVKSGIIPSIKELPQEGYFTLRFRKLGRENTQGVYSDETKTMIIDDMSVLLHEYMHLLDFNMSEDGVPMSETPGFYYVRELYTEAILKRIQETDLPDTTIQRELDTILVPEEMFARAFEYYLISMGIEGEFIGKMVDENSPNQIIHDLSYEVCEEPVLKQHLTNYFSHVFNDIDATKVDKYYKLLEKYNNDESDSTDLSTQLNTTHLDYSEMSKEERHICILAKKHLKNLSLKQTSNLIIQTDEIYDTGAKFPNDFVLVFQYNEEHDQITDVRVVKVTELDELSKQGYRTVNTKSVLKVEQNYYEMFYALGVAQQLEYNELVRRIKDMFRNS